MYSKNEKAIIFLTLFETISFSKQTKLINMFAQPSEILTNLVSAKKEIIAIVGSSIYENMLNVTPDFLKSYIDNLTNQNIVCITRFSEKFPSRLKQISESPNILFCKGDISLLDCPRSIGIVGTRMPSSYGRIVTENFSAKLAKSGFAIISGLASGVDKIAHEQALKNGAKTIAVLGGGFDNIYPAMNTNLAKEIVEKGLIVSEYRPNIRPTVYTFPFRNRIIAGLSDGVLLTEAGEKSGALYTKNYAIEYGKDLFVVPSNVNSPKGIGCNNVIKSMQGACVTCPEDILLKYNIQDVKEVKQEQTNLVEQLILETLADGEQTLEELQEKTKLETKNLNSCLTILQIRGLIKKLPANTYCL